MTVGQMLLRPTEAAAILGIGRTTLYALIRSGALPSVRIGGSRRIPASALRRFITDLAGEADGDPQDPSAQLLPAGVIVDRDD